MGRLRLLQVGLISLDRHVLWGRGLGLHDMLDVILALSREDTVKRLCGGACRQFDAKADRITMCLCGTIS